MKNKLRNFIQRRRVINYIGIGLLTSLIIFSCAKEEIVPKIEDSDNVSTSEEVDKKVLPVLYLTKDQEIIQKISNKDDRIVGKLTIKSDGKIIRFDFEPVNHRKFLAAYLHMDTKKDFPLWRNSRLPRLEAFDYKYQFMYRTNGDWKDDGTAETIVNSISPGKALFTVPVKDIPEKGLMALQVRLSSDPDSDRIDETGFGWLHGILFDKDDEAMYIYYTTKLPHVAGD